MMKSLIKMSLMLVALAVGYTLQAQNSKVETVTLLLDENYDKQSDEWFIVLDECITKIEEAKVHSKTSTNPKMWYQRARTFVEVANNGNEAQKAKYPNALDIAFESLKEAKKFDTKARYEKVIDSKFLEVGYTYYNAGVQASKLGNYQQAIDCYSKVKEIIPFDKDGAMEKNNVTVDNMNKFSAFAALEMKDYTLAASLLQKLIDNNYQDITIYRTMAALKLEEKDTTAALNFITQGKELDPENADLMKMELNILLAQGKEAEIMNKLNKAIEIEPDNKMLYFARAINKSSLGDQDGALADYDKALELDPDYADAHYNKGSVYLTKCEPIAKELDNLSDYSKEEGLNKQIDDLYMLAAESFENALEIGDYSDEDKYDLAKTLRQIYARLRQVNPEKYTPLYKEMKELSDSLEP
jgi:tetratricopeptide (TPR) repeat protein